MRSIGRQLTISLLVTFALLMAAGGVAVFLAVRAALYAQFDAGLRVKALMVITATEQRRGKINVRFSDRFLREFDDDVATNFFQVWSTGETVSIERSDSLGRNDLPRQFGTMASPLYWNFDLPAGQTPSRAVGIKFTPRVDDNDERTRQDPIEAIAVVAEHRGQLDAMLQRMKWILIGAGTGLIVATVAVAPLALRPGLRPLRQLGDQAGTIDAANLGLRFSVDGMPAELRPIGERLNALLERLENSFERERRFSSDLAHELLTPLAELRAIVESALKWPDMAGPEAHRQSLEILVRMENLVTRLLELCRAENGRLKPLRVSTSIPDLLREVWRSSAAAAESRNLAVSFTGADPCEATVDPILLRVIVGNLLSNAVEYTPAGGSVRISWECQNAGYTILIANDAPDLTRDDVSSMFDRFWRKEASRTGSQHSGLGLSVARELAHVLDARLEGSLSPDGVFCAELQSAPASYASPPV
jgi:two-component system sensor histidine kinase QseC